MFDHSKLITVEKFRLYSYDVDEYASTGVMESALGRVHSDVGIGLRNKETKEAVSIVSSRYPDPRQFLESTLIIEGALKRSGLNLKGAEYTTNVYDQGAKLELRARFPEHELTIDDKDKVVPQFVYRTSHNKTWAHSGMMGPFRAFCYNTLVSGHKLAYVYGKHTKNFNPHAFGEKIKNAGEYISGEGLNQMREWYHTEINREDVIDLFTHTLAKRTDRVSNKVIANKTRLSNLMKVFDYENRHLHGRGAYEEDIPRAYGTLWCVYQAATRWSSHSTGTLWHDGERTAPMHSVVGSREDSVRKMLRSSRWLALAA